MLTLEDYFGRVSHVAEPSDEVKVAAAILLNRVNALLAALNRRAEVNSGWRPASYNATITNAAPNSKHITGQAIDLADPDGDLDDILFKDPSLLIDYKLWMEHPLATKNWCHLQSVPPRSGNRIFFP